MFKYGVSTFIWSENFTEKDIGLIKKAKSLGFDVIDIFISISSAENFPVNLVKESIEDTGIEVVTTTTLDKETNFIDPDPNVRKNGIKSLKKIVDINAEIGSKILGGVNYAAWRYLTEKPKTEKEWSWYIESIKEVIVLKC